MTFYKSLLLTTLMVFTALPGHAAKHVIAAAELTSLFHTIPIDEKNFPTSFGAYYDILSKVIDDTGLQDEFELLVIPMRRAKRGFLNKTYACYAPGIDTFDFPDEVESRYDLLTSVPINVAKAKLVSAQGMPVLTSADEVKPDFAISIVSGVPENQEIKHILARAAGVIRVKSEVENLRAVMNHHATHAIIYLPDALLAYEKAGSPVHNYDEQWDLLTIKDAVTCHADYQGAFNKINQALMTMRASGELKRMLGQFYIPQ
ncbi:hypothetical protein [Alteromonas sp. CYL-A6]|uniref:hypothetical protein n=1 Tax=Alteromonas nitratireducens TaxID=3390813 RepID=UPI0034BD1CAD